jgi:peptide/nickel transport system permease protein
METLRKILKRKTSLIGAVILLIFFLTALVGPFLCAYDPLMTDPENKYAQPSGAHVLGTDYLGRDVFTRMVYGARVSLSISFIGVLSGAFIGIILGLLAGYYGKWIDTLISRFIDILLAFPGLLLAIMIVAILGKGIENTVIAVSVFSVPSIARLIRGLVISLRESEYLQACKVMGASDYRIIFHHILPNTAILTASSLSFLGLGVQPPSPEWGAMLSAAREVIRTYPMASIVPGVMITLVVLSFSMVGDGLRDALDPKLQYRFRGNV